MSGIIDSDEIKLNELSVNYDNINFYSNLDDALKQNFDGFIVATPPETHFEIGQKIIQKGIPLLIEKPFCLCLDEAQQLVDDAKSKNINTDARQSHGEVETGGIKVRVLGEDSNDFKFKIRNKN